MPPIVPSGNSSNPPAVVRPGAARTASVLERVQVGQLPPDPYLLGTARDYLSSAAQSIGGGMERRVSKFLSSPQGMALADNVLKTLGMPRAALDAAPTVPVSAAATPPPPQTIESSGRVSDRLPKFLQRSPANDARAFGDGYDSSRDITGVEADEGAPADPYLLRITLNNLKPDAANGHLDAYWLIGTGKRKKGSTQLPDGLRGTTARPWNLAVGAYDDVFSKVVDADGKSHDGAVKSVQFDAVRRVVEVTLDKAALREAGWKDGEPLTLQALTSRDHSGDVADTLDAPGKKPWQNGDLLSKAVNTAEAPVPPSGRSTDWSGESIYFTFTDRFANGDRTNDAGVDSDLRHYHGGDLRGVIDKLDYIKDLGMTTLWISPPFANQTRMGDYDGFHGYWPVDFYKVDPRQGDMATMKELVQKAHDRGMKVLMDLPLNQAAWDHEWAKDPSKSGWFHHEGDIQNWEDPHQVEYGNVLGLPDLAQENPEVAEKLIDIAKFWIDQTGIDGFRLDAVKHVTFSFWPQFSKAIHDHAGPDFLLLGEDLHGYIPHVARYQNAGVESMLDFPMYYAVRDSIGSGGSMKVLADRIADENRGFDNARMLSLFIDNHDLNRFMSDAEKSGGDARRKLQLALALMFTLDRIPNVYMGDEVGMDGTQEMDNAEKLPYNRKDMDFSRDPEMRSYFQQLGNLRKSTEALREGGYVEAWKDDQVFAFERPSRHGTAFVVLNGSADGQHRDVPVPPTGNMKDGMKLRDVLSGREVVVRDGRVPVDAPGRAASIYVPI